MQSSRGRPRGDGGGARQRLRGFPRLLLRRVLLVPLTLLLSGLIAVPAGAYETTGTLTLESGTLAPGESVTVSGEGFEPGTSVSIDANSDPIHLMDVTATSAGSISASVTIPSGLSAGEHSLTATGAAAAGGTSVLELSFTVEAADDSSGLATTGRSIVMWTVTGSLLLIAGVFLVLVSHRRRQKTVAVANGFPLES
ncbi:MAG: hypothetical protein HKP61_17025 [Dactylosporangium sp.]|nr:hypothetical protein [Dactylosporangium sp.]NNJ62610.1 hypothetical protein [Dactylosporangium sp.]